MASGLGGCLSWLIGGASMGRMGMEQVGEPEWHGIKAKYTSMKLMQETDAQMFLQVP